MLTKEAMVNLAEAKALAQQASSILDEIGQSGPNVEEVVRLREALGGALWRLTDAAGLVSLVADAKGPTGRGFIVADIYRE